MTREEYIEYREKFLEFDDEFIKNMEQKRLKNGINKPKEYLTINEFVPIKQVMENIINKKKKRIRKKD